MVCVLTDHFMLYLNNVILFCEDTNRGFGFSGYKLCN